jgi:hypothetical protein
LNIFRKSATSISFRSALSLLNARRQTKRKRMRKNAIRTRTIPKPIKINGKNYEGCTGENPMAGERGRMNGEAGYLSGWPE